ncbi:PHP domain-containing protein [Clostridium algidicarnis]|uniref:PHP domain-containing protein n=1 Tax=Clostridium algidicarnis DSM 15099 TaxID=1121295 RepID=A0A2S6G0L9_9CLOT|nr:PHP domain-containing protein [Clostridium algidicarnis]PPK49301.1 PHP domain-containing protein [Clostridium algidicarnis DSM 15099]
MYSKWNKIDLHIHTDMSKQTKPNDYSGTFSTEILYKKIKANKIDLISLTDHNIINCLAYDELSKKDINYLVGVEVDISISEENMINYVKNIKNNSLEKFKSKPFHALIFFSTKDHNLISEKLEKMYESISNSKLKNIVNLTNEKIYRVTTINYLVKHFCDEDFFIIAHGNKDKGIVKPYNEAEKIDDAQKEILIGGISALEMKSNANMQNVINHYNEGFKKLMREDFKIARTTAYVVFSDNHDCENYKLRNMQTWIKGQPNYETLRLAFSDPESRIHTSDREPIVNANYIESISFKLNNGQEQILELSPQLNVIIGGRSSGKSLLFNTLISMNNEFTEDDKELFKKNYSDMINKKSTSVKLNIGQYSSSYSLPGESFYQEAIIKLFEKENDLKSKLENEFLEISDIDIRKIENELDDMVSEFNNSYKEYYHVASKLDKGDIEEHIKIVIINSNKLFELNLNDLIVKKDLNEYDLAIEKIENFSMNIDEIKKIKIEEQSIFNENELILLNNVLTMLQGNKKDIEVKRDKEEVKIKFKEYLKEINSEYVDNELSTEKKLIEQTKNKLGQMIDDYEMYFKSKLRLKKVCEKVEKLDMKIEDKINTKSKYKFITKVNLNINGNTIVDEFFKDKIKNYSDKKSLFDNMLLFADISMDEIRLKQMPTDGKSPERLKEKMSIYIKNIKSKKTYEIVECLEGGHEVSTLSTSQGKKASIFLDIKLKNMSSSHEKSVLFIDQLEDNIDNKFISEELVSLIRKLKRKMQIILVTHNPSIAIYGDAENVIISENNGNEFVYKQGGLEDIAIREEACSILDGGEVAFKNRMDKYNIAILKEEV